MDGLVKGSGEKSGALWDVGQLACPRLGATEQIPMLEMELLVGAMQMMAGFLDKSLGGLRSCHSSVCTFHTPSGMTADGGRLELEIQL